MLFLAEAVSEIVWAQPGLKWDGFKPQAYCLDTEKVWKLIVTDAQSKQEMTIGDIVDAFRGKKVELDDRTLELALKSESKQLVIKGPDFYLDLLKILYRFTNQGTSILELLWFYYDSDSCTGDPQNMYTFFVVAHDKILDERVSLSDWSNNGFDPGFLVPASLPDPTWFDEPHWDRATDRFWYRKFYSETRTGQLMVLRPDEPELYYYTEGRSKAGGGIEGWLSQIHRALTHVKIATWILVGLVALLLYLRWR